MQSRATIRGIMEFVHLEILSAALLLGSALFKWKHLLIVLFNSQRAKLGRSQPVRFLAKDTFTSFYRVSENEMQ